MWVPLSTNLMVPHSPRVFAVLADEFKGHMQLEYAQKGDISKMKKTLSSKLANFQHPQTQETPLVCMLASASAKA